MNTNTEDNFDFDSFDKSFDDMFLTNSDDMINTATLGDLSDIYSYNDTIIENKDMFDVGNLKSSNYNKDTIDNKLEKTPSENLNNVDIFSNKNKVNKIEYINGKNSEDVDYDNINLLGEFYDLEISDYPKRTTTKSSDINNKSLGAGKNDFFSKFFGKNK